MPAGVVQLSGEEWLVSDFWHKDLKAGVVLEQIGFEHGSDSSRPRHRQYKKIAMANGRGESQPYFLEPVQN